MKHLHANFSLLIVAVAVTATMIFAYYFMYTRVRNAFNKALVAQSIVLAQKDDSKMAQATKALYEKTTNDRDRLPTFFVSNSNAVAFIENLEHLGSQVGSNVSLSSVTADEPSTLAAGTFGKISAKVDVTGSWSAVMRTLKLSELLPYQSTVELVSLESSIVADKKDPKKSIHSWHLSYNVTATILADATSTKP